MSEPQPAKPQLASCMAIGDADKGLFSHFYAVWWRQDGRQEGVSELVFAVVCWSSVVWFGTYSKTTVTNPHPTAGRRGGRNCIVPAHCRAEAAVFIL